MRRASARRILESRGVDWREGRESVPFDDADLALVEDGLPGMRHLESNEMRMLSASRAASERRRQEREQLAQEREEARQRELKQAQELAKEQQLRTEEQRLRAEQQEEAAARLQKSLREVEQAQKEAERGGSPCQGQRTGGQCRIGTGKWTFDPSLLAAAGP